MFVPSSSPMMHVSPQQGTEGIPSSSPFPSSSPLNQTPQNSLYPNFPVVFLPPGMQNNMQPQGNGTQNFLNPMQFTGQVPSMQSMPPVQVNLPPSEQLESQASPPVNGKVVTDSEQESKNVTTTEDAFPRSSSVTSASTPLNMTPQQGPMQPQFPMQSMQFTPVMFPQMPMQNAPQMPMQAPQFPMQAPMVPTIVQVQTPQGIQYMQTYGYAQPPLAPNQMFMGSGNFLNPPEQHPTMMIARSDSQSSYSRSRCGRSNSSRDGSENGDYNNQIKMQRSSSLNRFNSDVSISRDGYGSDSGYSRSRMGSEYFDDEYSERDDEDSPKYQHHFYSPERRKRPTSKERQEELYKTELCNAWINQKKCRFGSRCIFAHGQHELRLPQRKLERNKLRPPLRTHIASLLNRLTDANSDTVVTELLSVCVEDIVNDIEKVKIVAREFFNKAITDKTLKHLYATAWRKLLYCHPLNASFAQFMEDNCMTKYLECDDKDGALGCMEWVSVLVTHNVSGTEGLAHRILNDMFEGDIMEVKIELWCKLIELLKDRVDTNKYIEHLNTNLKTTYGSKVRFVIMDLIDLKARCWVPADC